MQFFTVRATVVDQQHCCRLSLLCWYKQSGTVCTAVCVDTNRSGTVCTDVCIDTNRVEQFARLYVLIHTEWNSLHDCMPRKLESVQRCYSGHFGAITTSTQRPRPLRKEHRRVWFTTAVSSTLGSRLARHDITTEIAAEDSLDREIKWMMKCMMIIENMASLCRGGVA